MSENSLVQLSRRSFADALAPVLVAWMAVTLLVVALWSARRGLDRVDESYVLAGIAHPDASRAAGEVTFSSYLLHPLYALLDGDIVRYRMVGILLVAALAALTTTECLRCVPALTKRGVGGWELHLGWIGAAATSVTAFTFGLRSLSYNSVVLIGLLVAAIGLSRMIRGAAASGGLFAACGFWLTFLGKPTSAAALGVVGLVALALTRRLTVRGLATAFGALIVAMIVTLVAVRMTPSETVAFLDGGVQQDRLLGGHVSLLPLVGIAGAPMAAFFVFGTPLLLAGVVAAELLLRTRGRRLRIVGVALVGVAAATIATVALPGLVDRGLGQQILPFVLVILAFGAWVVARDALSRSGRTSDEARESRPVVGLVVALALMPYVAAVGTNSPFTEAMPHAAVFWLIATLVGLHSVGSPAVDGQILITVVVSLSVTGVMLVAALLDGGTRESLLAATTPVPVAGGTLLLPPQEASAAIALNDIADREELTPVTPVIDLTGIAPGYAFQLGGRPIGRESFMGVFPGAPEAAAYAISRASCQDQRDAWLLWSANSAWDVSRAVRIPGRRIPEDYQVVGEFVPVQGPAPWRTVRVQVLRPSADVAEKVCP